MSRSQQYESDLLIGTLKQEIHALKTAWAMAMPRETRPAFEERLKHVDQQLDRLWNVLGD